MGWYDAFRGNTARVNLSRMGDNTGSAAKNFGDAFEKIGARMYDTEVDREKEELRELQKQNTQLAIDKTQDEMQTKKFDDAFSTGYQSFENKDEWDQFKSVATTTKDGEIVPLYEPSSEAVKQENQFFQTKFNDEAVSESVKGGYDGFDAYKQANPTLIQNADGTILGKIEQYYAGKDNKAAEIDAKTKELKHQAQINDLKAKVNSKDKDKNTDKYLLDLQNSIGKEYGKYDEVTGMFTIDDASKDEAKFALDYGTELLNSGITSLSTIRSLTKKKFEEVQDETQSKDPLGLGI